MLKNLFFLYLFIRSENSKENLDSESVHEKNELSRRFKVQFEANFSMRGKFIKLTDKLNNSGLFHVKINFSNSDCLRQRERES